MSEMKQSMEFTIESAPPILDRIKAKLDSVKTNPDVPKDSALMGAVKYALNEWEWVPGIFNSGDYDLDNNLIERMRGLCRCLDATRSSSAPTRVARQLPCTCRLSCHAV